MCSKDPWGITHIHNLSISYSFLSFLEKASLILLAVHFYRISPGPAHARKIFLHLPDYLWAEDLMTITSLAAEFGKNLAFTWVYVFSNSLTCWNHLFVCLPQPSASSWDEVLACFSDLLAGLNFKTLHSNYLLVFSVEAFYAKSMVFWIVYSWSCSLFPFVKFCYRGGRDMLFYFQAFVSSFTSPLAPSWLFPHHWNVFRSPRR